MTETISVIGNCQAVTISDYLATMIKDAEFSCGYSREIRNGKVDLADLVQSDSLIVQTAMLDQVRSELERLSLKREILVIPTIYFTGYHPDYVYVTGPSGNINCPMATANSAIVFAAWSYGLSAAEATSLFNSQTYRALGYYEYLQNARTNLLTEADGLNFDIHSELELWENAAPFMHTPNHPKPAVFAGICRVICAKLGRTPATKYPDALFPDKLASSAIWPIYPELGEAFGCEGEYVFKPANGKLPAGVPLQTFDLREFVEGSFEAYNQYDKQALACTRLKDARYKEALKTVRRDTPAARPASHPYKALPQFQFWRKSFPLASLDQFDPVVDAKTIISPTTKIATAGSCFAQHIAKSLSASGYFYFTPETNASLSMAEQTELQYGVFSCRYGNIYTAAQLRQLLERSIGEFVPADSAWLRNDGVFVDPFRPRINPAGYPTEEAVAADRAVHLSHVRDMWREMDVFVFTLGLTEAWRAKCDGAVFPLAPGVSGGEMDQSKYEFHNCTVEEVVGDFASFHDKLKTINPNVKVILTVSPVPLEATYEPRHVLVSTTYSKSVLRAAAEEICKICENVEYFPSYEIITGNYNRGAYFNDDLREVRPEGVAHVMSRFLAHHTTDGSRTGSSGDQEWREGQAVICDEEALTAS